MIVSVQFCAYSIDWVMICIPLGIRVTLVACLWRTTSKAAHKWYGSTKLVTSWILKAFDPSSLNFCVHDSYHAWCSHFLLLLYSETTHGIALTSYKIPWWVAPWINLHLKKLKLWFQPMLSPLGFFVTEQAHRLIRSMFSLLELLPDTVGVIHRHMKSKEKLLLKWHQHHRVAHNW